jgi:hypothetical protein
MAFHSFTVAVQVCALLRTAGLHSASAAPGLKFRPRKFQRPLEFLSRFPAVPDEEDAVRKMIPLVAVSWIAGAMSFAETITVRVHNVAGAHAAVIAEGKRGASRTLEQVGIAIEWADCPSVDPGRISSQTCEETYEPSRFTVVIDAGFVNAPIEDTALGFALPHLAGRNHAAVVYPRIQQLAAENHDLMDCGTLLGVVLAHELAHLLFGSMSHGAGIMLANWTRGAFKSIGQRRFSFTPQQGAELRAGLRSRYSASPGESRSRATPNLTATQNIGVAD